MALYDKPVRTLMWDMVADLKLRKGDIITRDRVLEWFTEHYPKVKEGTIGAHLIRLSTNARSRHYYAAKPKDDDLFYQINGSRFRLYDHEQDPEPLYEQQLSSGQPAAGETEDAEPPGEFAYEADLRNYLAKNLPLLEPGLRLYEEEGIRGIEFPAGGRFIDILAVDSRNGYVVIELKVSRGYDRVVGQLLRYMAWVEKNHAEAGKAVRGFIVARDLSEDLVLACSHVPGITLFEYTLSVQVRKVDR
jgi:hypothetical protein